MKCRNCQHANLDHEYDGCVVGVEGVRCGCGTFSPDILLNDEQRESLRRVAGFDKDSEQDRNLRAVVELIVRRHKTEAWAEGRDHGRDNSRDGYCLCINLDWSETDICVNPYA